MIQKAREAHPLFLTAAEHILPLLPRVPPALAVGEVPQAGVVEHALEVVLRDALGPHVAVAVRVDDLVPQGADAEVGPLGEEHDAVLAVVLGAADEAAVDRPEAREDARNGRLADAVGAGDLWSVSNGKLIRGAADSMSIDLPKGAHHAGRP